MDLFIGRRLAHLMRAAGLVGVQQAVSVDEWSVGHPRRMQIIQFVENIWDRGVSGGIFSDGELSDLLAAVRRHLDDPETLVLSTAAFRAWGQKPA